MVPNSTITHPPRYGPLSVTNTNRYGCLSLHYSVMLSYHIPDLKQCLTTSVYIEMRIVLLNLTVVKRYTYNYYEKIFI